MKLVAVIVCLDGCLHVCLWKSEGEGDLLCLCNKVWYEEQMDIIWETELELNECNDKPSASAEQEWRETNGGGETKGQRWNRENDGRAERDGKT